MCNLTTLVAKLVLYPINIIDNNTPSNGGGLFIFSGSAPQLFPGFK